MAGAGIAFPDEAMAVVNNPAVAAAVNGRAEVGLALYRPRSNYWSTESTENGQNGTFTIGPNAIDAESQNLFVPSFASSWQWQEDSAFAVALYGRTGIDTEYQGGTATFDPDGPGPEPVGTYPGTLGDGDVKTKLTQALLDLAYAKQLTEQVSLGVSAVLAAQSFSISGVSTLAPLTYTFVSSGGSVMPQNLSGNGADKSYGAGIKAGVHFQWNPQLSLGLMYQTKIYMSEVSSYSDLFPSGGNFDIPADFKAGLSWHMNDSLVLSLDMEWIFYSGVDALSNTLEDLFQCPTAGAGGTDLNSCLGGSHGGGLGWKDDTSYKIGLDWKLGPKWSLRAGLA
ncbi:MAG: OmpP1/FadL family transporter, partial [Lysobacterales bacterium]